MNKIKSIILVLSMLFAISCMDMYNDLADELGAEYDYFLGVSQSVASGKTFVYSIEKTGSIGSQISGQFYTGATPVSIAVHPSGNFLYVSYSNRLYLDVYTIGADGTQRLIQSAGPLSNNPSNIKIHPSGKYLYCSIGTGNLIAKYNIDDNGTLTGLMAVSTIINAVGNTPSKLTIAPSGNYLYAVTSNAVVGYTINSDGTLPSIPSFEFHDATAEIVINNNSNIIADRQGHLYLTGIDYNTSPLGYVNLYCFDNSLNNIDINTDPVLKGYYITGVGVFNTLLAFPPTGNILYVGFHFSYSGAYNNQFGAYRVNSNGSVDQIGTMITSHVGISSSDVFDITVSPNNTFLFGTNKTAGEIEVLKINEDGSLSSVSQTVNVANASNLALIRKKK